MDTILLFSGGLDSLVSAGLLLEENPKRHLLCLFFDYGQHTAEREWQAAQQCSSKLERTTLEHHTVKDYISFVKDIAIVSGTNIPSKDGDPRLNFVPGRNILFLLYAAIIGYKQGYREIALSSQAWDKTSGDCSPHFITALEEAFAWGFGTEGEREPYRIWSPVGTLGKDDIAREGTRLGLPLHQSWSCYDTQDLQCGVCHNCYDRRRGFEVAHIPDPTVYMK